MPRIDRKLLVKLKDWSVIGLLCLCILIFVFGLPLGIREYIVQAYKIPAGSMVPTLLIGDHILVKKYSITRKNIEHGDIIVFKYPKDETKDFVKRVIGLPGENLEIRDKQVFINDQPLKENYIIFTDPMSYDTHAQPRDNFSPIVIPNDSYFVMGDNRDRSMDSRYWGFVKLNKIKGKVFLIYWSWDKENEEVRWDRLWKSVH